MVFEGLFFDTELGVIDMVFCWLYSFYGNGWFFITVEVFSKPTSL